MMGTFMNDYLSKVTWPSVGAGMHLDSGTIIVPCLLMIYGRPRDFVPESGCSSLGALNPPIDIVHYLPNWIY